MLNFLFQHQMIKFYIIKLHKNYITFYYYARIISRKKITTITTITYIQ